MSAEAKHILYIKVSVREGGEEPSTIFNLHLKYNNFQTHDDTNSEPGNQRGDQGYKRKKERKTDTLE